MNCPIEGWTAGRWRRMSLVFGPSRAIVAQVPVADRTTALQVADAGLHGASTTHAATKGTVDILDLTSFASPTSASFRSLTELSVRSPTATTGPVSTR